jgi:hypothetical protein
VRETLGTLNQLSAALVQYKESTKSLPTNLSQVRWFRLLQGQNIKIFDGFGQRIDYVKLSDSNYLLRSYGEDGIQNTLNSEKDIGLMRWGPLPLGGSVYLATPSMAPHFYRAAALLGIDSPDGSWTARLFVNKLDHKRLLLVRHRTIPDLVMIASHERVEEFYWTESNKIAYTATESLRHRDGLYLWDLAQDTATDLMREARLEQALDQNQLVPLNDRVERGFWLSLAGFDGSQNRIYAYILPKIGFSLDPEFFFAQDNLYEFDVGVDSKRIVGRRGSQVKASVAQNPLSEKIMLGSPYVLKKKGTQPIQEKWLALPTSGHLESAILTWQQFSIKQNKTPLFPYSLWYLTSLYSESFVMLKTVNPREAGVLRTYGAEIARALMNDGMAPSYLRAMGFFGYQTLLKGDPLPYRIFNRLGL